MCLMMVNPLIFRLKLLYTTGRANLSSANLSIICIFCVTSVQEAPLHQELHPPQPLLLLRPESRGRVGERRHPLQPNLAVLQPAVTGEVATSVNRRLHTRVLTAHLSQEEKQSQRDASSHSL